MGSVLTWHMYVPESEGLTFSTCSFHVLWPLWVTDSRGFGATMCVCIARISRESDFIQATCDSIFKIQSYILIILLIYIYMHIYEIRARAPSSEF